MPFVVIPAIIAVALSSSFLLACAIGNGIRIADERRPR